MVCFAGSGRTLRDGPLESSPIVRLLKEKFISSWTLVAELKVGKFKVCELRSQSRKFKVRKFSVK